jgi:hypothetical protein
MMITNITRRPITEEEGGRRSITCKSKDSDICEKSTFHIDKSSHTFDAMIIPVTFIKITNTIVK